jgi:hypothetical protein
MIFINNKYTRTYFRIIESAKIRDNLNLIYTENHHIIPQSLGGENTKENIVTLSAREHFICHWLLTKMTSGMDQRRMTYACKMMMHSSGEKQKRYTPKQYETKKINLNKKLKNRVFTPEWKDKLKGPKQVSQEDRERRSKLMTELNRSRKGEKREWMTGENNVFTKEDTKIKIKKSLLSRYGVENPALVPWVCEFCGKEGKGLSGYKRWHGDACRFKINTL